MKYVVSSEGNSLDKSRLFEYTVKSREFRRVEGGITMGGGIAYSGLITWKSFFQFLIVVVSFGLLVYVIINKAPMQPRPVDEQLKSELMSLNEGDFIEDVANGRVAFVYHIWSGHSDLDLVDRVGSRPVKNSIDFLSRHPAELKFVRKGNPQYREYQIRFLEQR